MLLRACLAMLGLSSARGFAQGVTPADSTGTIVGIVTVKEAGLPLPYSVAASAGHERFSDAQGVFVLAGIPSGEIDVRVRHVGYVPATLHLVLRGGQVDTVRVQLDHIAVQLAAVTVHAYPPCRAPGAPSGAKDSAFAVVFDQLRQNADQFRLLADAYPFRTAVERTLTHVMADGGVRTDGVDTVAIASHERWLYKPGGVISRSRQRGRQAVTTMAIPTLANFADKVFIENHCFYNGGIESVGGSPLLRVDFNAAERIEDPDVEGSMYLDPSTFQIRRSVLRLSRIPRGLDGVEGTEAVTTFGEVLPSIPVIADVASVTRIQARNRGPKVASTNEHQRLLRVEFLKGMPGDEGKKP